MSTLEPGNALSGNQKVNTAKYPQKGAIASLSMGLALCAFLFSFSGCGSQPIKEDPQLAAKPIIWPSPPEPARISYSTTIAKPSDIGANKGFFKKLAEFVLGSKTEDIVKPYGVVTDSTERIIVADTAFKRVHIYDAKNNKYSYIDELDDDRYLESPISAAVDGEDNIYVTDSVLNKILVFSPKGEYLRSIGEGKRLTGIAINKQDKLLYMSDTASHNIGVYDLKGSLVNTIGKLGDKDGEFNYPVDLFINSNNELYVTDTMNFRIQIFDKDGKFISKIGRHGDGTGDLGRPKGVAADHDGNIYIVDAIFDTVQIFDRSGNFLLNFGSVGREAGKFWSPSGIYIDSTDKIYVADSYNKRIQVFEYHGN